MIKSSEETVEMDIHLQIADALHMMSLPDKFCSSTEKQKYKSFVETQVREKKMLYLYDELTGNKKGSTSYQKHVSHSYSQRTYPYFNFDQGVRQELENAVQQELAELKENVKKAQESEGETEVRQAKLDIAHFYKRIGDWEQAQKSYEQCIDESIGVGPKLDLIFNIMRIQFFVLDTNSLKSLLERSKRLLEEGGDWERKNRLKIYEGIAYILLRDFLRASRVFLDSVSTFSATELMTYETFIYYTVTLSVLALDRPELNKRVILNSDILTVIGSLAPLEEYLHALYNSKYNTFLVKLCEILDQMQTKRYMSRHTGFFSREMRILAYKQFLKSYKSVTMQSISQAFGLSIPFLDEELARFIANRRLPCKIDRVRQVVETQRDEERTEKYLKSIKQGDILLNRIQKLSRVMDL